VKEEVDWLLQAGFIQPCRYAEWVSNIIPVEKKNTGKIQICVDFRNLNRATPKDEFPMPVADLLVDSTSGNKVISFLNCNAGYNQIFMVKEDVSRTVFRCPVFVGPFEWVVMTFGLKNAGATYQRGMNLIFHDMLISPLCSPNHIGLDIPYPLSPFPTHISQNPNPSQDCRGY
jgi:hypothetical protein